MRIAITGSKGQLGRQLVAAFAGHQLLELDLPETDITHLTICDDIARWEPELILHAAAYTDVDGCEQNVELAFRVNAIGTQHVALAAQRTDAMLVYISTNEVFDGTRRDHYREWDQVNPVSVYARSKTAGEQIVRDLLSRFYIVRVAWLFGPGGSNFVTKILAAADKNPALRIAADEFGNPTYAPDLAAAIAKLVDTGHFGIYHLTNAGFCSRFEFAREIMRLTQRTDVSLTPILSADWPRATRPPLHAILANTNAAALGITLRPWQEALAEYLATM